MRIDKYILFLTKKTQKFGRKKKERKEEEEEEEEEEESNLKIEEGQCKKKLMTK